MKNKFLSKGFTILEIILSLSLVIILITSLSIIFVNFSKTALDISNDAESNQQLDNLEYYLRYELNPQNISIIDNADDKNILSYEKFYRQENYYVLSEKKLRLNKVNKRIILDTKNKFYSLESNGYVYKFEKQESSNIVSENIENFEKNYDNKVLKINLSILNEGKPYSRKIIIEDLDNKKFI